MQTRVKTFICVLCILPFLLCAAPHTEGFRIPERLVFDLSWTGIRAGTATMEIRNDRDEIRVISTALSAQWVSAFYPVEDRVESVLVKGQNFFIGLPRLYRVNIREGRHRRSKEVTFEHSREKAVFQDHLKGEKGEMAIGKNTLDPLSGFYYIRMLKMEVGKPLSVNLFDSKKVWDVEVQVLRKERIDTVLGAVDTIVIRPVLKSEGIFSRKGDMFIWLTDDARRLPVRMQTKVAVGYVTATLVSGVY